MPTKQCKSGITFHACTFFIFCRSSSISFRLENSNKVVQISKSTENDNETCHFQVSLGDSTTNWFREARRTVALTVVVKLRSPKAKQIEIENGGEGAWTISA